MDVVIQEVINLKSFMVANILDYPATFHAVDVVSRIVGWEVAAKKDKSIDLPKRVRQIYEEALGKVN